MARIVRRLYKNGYHYVAIDTNNKRIGWRRIKGNKEAKKELLPLIKLSIKEKPTVTANTNVSKVTWKSLDKEKNFARSRDPSYIKNKSFYVNVNANIYFKGRFIGNYDGTSKKTTYEDKQLAEELALNTAIRRAVRESGDVENYPNKIPPKEYTAKVVSLSYHAYIPNTKAARYL